jgi:rubrerythrin
MSSNQKETLDAIMRAMEIEKETFDFYTHAADKTFNEAGKRIFRWLAKTEEQHYLAMTELYSSLDNNGRWVFYGGSTISLQDENDKAIGFETNDLDALEIAMSIEKKGIAYFDELARTTADPDGQAMLKRILEEEREHLRIIADRYKTLQAK